MSAGDCGSADLVDRTAFHCVRGTNDGIILSGGGFTLIKGHGVKVREFRRIYILLLS